MECEVNDLMTNWIAEHPSLIAFLRMEEVVQYEKLDIPTKFREKRKRAHDSVCARLQEKFNAHITRQKPENFIKKKLQTNLPLFQNNQLSYVILKIKKLYKKQFDEYSKNVAELLNFFGNFSGFSFKANINGSFNGSGYNSINNNDNGNNIDRGNDSTVVLGQISERSVSSSTNNNKTGNFKHANDQTFPLSSPISVSTPSSTLGNFSIASNDNDSVLDENNLESNDNNLNSTTNNTIVNEDLSLDSKFSKSLNPNNDSINQNNQLSNNLANSDQENDAVSNSPQVQNSNQIHHKFPRFYIPENIIFSFDVEKFERFSFQTPKKIISLRCYVKLMEVEIDRLKNMAKRSFSNKKTESQKIAKIIEGISPLYDDALSFYPMNRFDTEFEKFIYTPFFPFQNEYKELVEKFDMNDQAVNVANILALAYKMIRHYKLGNSASDSILFLLIFRCVFSDLYAKDMAALKSATTKETDTEPEMNKEFGEGGGFMKKTFVFRNNINRNENNDANHNVDHNANPNSNYNVNNNENYKVNNNSNSKVENMENYSNNNDENYCIFRELPSNCFFGNFFRCDRCIYYFSKSLTFAQIEPPDDSKLYLEFTKELNINNTISIDPRFKKSISALFEMQFATNPLDALNCVRLCLKGIETASDCFFEKVECMIPFDKIFTLFLFVICSTNIQEIQDYMKFVAEGLPEKLLSLPFQFALTKLSAAERHLKSLM